MPTYTPNTPPSSPSYNQTVNPGNVNFDNPVIIFDDQNTFFDGGNATWNTPASPTSPSYTTAPAPS